MIEINKIDEVEKNSFVWVKNNLNCIETIEFVIDVGEENWVDRFCFSGNEMINNSSFFADGYTISLLS